MHKRVCGCRNTCSRTHMWGSKESWYQPLSSTLFWSRTPMLLIVACATELPTNAWEFSYFCFPSHCRDTEIIHRGHHNCLWVVWTQALKCAWQTGDPLRHLPSPTIPLLRRAWEHRQLCALLTDLQCAQGYRSLGVPVPRETLNNCLSINRVWAFFFGVNHGKMKPRWARHLRLQTPNNIVLSNNNTQRHATALSGQLVLHNNFYFYVMFEDAVKSGLLLQNVTSVRFKSHWIRWAVKAFSRM